jgi:hypothetical protein
MSDNREIRSWEVDKDLARPVSDARIEHSERSEGGSFMEFVEKGSALVGTVQPSIWAMA